MGANIAVLGLGAMGSRMAQVLLRAGNKVTVYNRSPEPARLLMESGAAVAASPREAVRDSEVVIAIVTDVEASRQIWLHPESGALRGLNQGSIAIECSTVTPEWVQTLAGEMSRQGIDFLECPVIGTLPQAESGALVALVGGDHKILESARPVLSLLAKKIVYVGEPGHGATLKLGVNALFGIQVVAISEIIGTTVRSGIGLAQLETIFSELPVTSPAAMNSLRQIAAQNFKSLFPIRLVAKDLDYMAALARQADVRVPMVETTLNLFREANSAGLSDKNITAISLLYGALSDAKADGAGE